jgi:hypothetical protein
MTDKRAEGVFAELQRQAVVGAEQAFIQIYPREERETTIPLRKRLGEKQTTRTDLTKGAIEERSAASKKTREE